MQSVSVAVSHRQRIVLAADKRERPEMGFGHRCTEESPLQIGT